MTRAVRTALGRAAIDCLNCAQQIVTGNRFATFYFGTDPDDPAIAWRALRDAAILWEERKRQQREALRCYGCVGMGRLFREVPGQYELEGSDCERCKGTGKRER